MPTLTDYVENEKCNLRPRSRAELAAVFIECVTCGAYKILSRSEQISDQEAVRRAHKCGWQVAGQRNRKNTRCPKCRQKTYWGGGYSNDRTFANRDLRYGMFSRGAPNPKPIQRSHGMKHPDNPPLDSLEATTIPVELLRGEALLAHVEAVGEHGQEWAPPDPLKRCTRCGKHAALYQDDGKFYCGPCGPRVSLFRLPIKPTDLRQIAADKALEQFEKGQADD